MNLARGRLFEVPRGIEAGQPRSADEGNLGPFPPEPPVQITGELQHLLSKADRALGVLAGSVLTLPNPDLFVPMFVRKEAVLSSRIEGKRSSLHDVLGAEASVPDPQRPRDVGEVLAYIEATNHGLARLAELPVSIRLICEIHGVLMAAAGPRVTPGELRRSQTWIGSPGATLAEATFVPPPPDLVPEALSQLERFLHACDDLPALIRVGMAHAHFETIHPFLDGNGRVGRLLITLLLCEHGTLTKPVLYLSRFFERHRSHYYELLQGVHMRGEFEEWLAFFLRGVTQTGIEAARTAGAILRLREEHRREVTERLGRAAANGLRVLEHLYEEPVVSAKEVQALLGTTFAGANQIVGRLVGLGLLTEITGNARNRRFRYEPYVRLFMDEAGDGDLVTGKLDLREAATGESVV